MKRLYVFSIRSFTGPFIATFCISMFILILQFLWKYIDDLMGKGISITVILELLFFVSASLIPLALPLAILLSSIMTFGNLSEHNELTALKSSGLSLYKIMRPLTIVVLIIAASTFYFANYVIPVANLKWHSLIYDIQNTKISSIITPGVFSKELDGYAIKVKKEHNNSFEDVLIYDHTDPNKLKTIRAKSGRIYKSNNGKYLFFELNDGNQSEELNPEAPTFLPTGEINPTISNNRKATQTAFSKATIKIDISGFQLSRTDENLFKDQFEMLNVFQMEYAMDSIQKDANQIMTNFINSLKNDHLFYSVQKFSKSQNNNSINSISTADATIINYDTINTTDKINALTNTASRLRQKNVNLDGQKEYMSALDYNIVQFAIAFHKKFALTFAIIVLFFVGAPLGAIIRKGGFGAPVVIAALLFMVYFILISVGESLAQEQVVSPILGMWFATFVLMPFALVFMIAAANDSPVFKKETYSKIFQRITIKKVKK